MTAARVRRISAAEKKAREVTKSLNYIATYAASIENYLAAVCEVSEKRVAAGRTQKVVASEVALRSILAEIDLLFAHACARPKRQACIALVAEISSIAAKALNDAP